MSLLIHPNDPNKMNWIDGKHDFGETVCIDGISATRERFKTKEGLFKEKYIFTNETDFDLFTQKGDIGIYTPFNDNYESADICMTNRCHTHIWCGFNSSYIMALRMGGKAPHLGLFLTQGSLDTYSVERDKNEISNDRGDFILHPTPIHLKPGESFIIEWELFWHNGKEDFYRQIKKYSNYIGIHAEKFTLYKGENMNFCIKANNLTGIEIKCNGRPVQYEINDKHTIKIKYKTERIGKQKFIIKIGGTITKASFMVLPNLMTFAKTRCHFIVNRQQYFSGNSPLDGAYLIYDNEEEGIYYNHQNDHNGGRERVGMGILIAKYLQKNKDDFLMASLRKYIEYVKRELFDIKTGEVYNDIRRNNDHYRLYNHPWISLFFLEIYFLTNSKEYLMYSVKAIKMYYKNGGTQFYPIELPMYEIISALKHENEMDIIQELMSLFKEHADFIIQTGTSYPASEVNYEQSIVSPAANCLLQIYRLTMDDKYLLEAKNQLKILELFNAMAPDYHLHETAIRHWDGYWFGKHRMLGDTFPHYWSGVTGNVFLDYYKITKDEKYYIKAINSIRGTLNLIKADGRASCANIFPFKVNGEKADMYDPWANDQDWGLYFALRLDSEYDS